MILAEIKTTTPEKIPTVAGYIRGGIKLLLDGLSNSSRRRLATLFFVGTGVLAACAPDILVDSSQMELKTPEPKCMPQMDTGTGPFVSYSAETAVKAPIKILPTEFMLDQDPNQIFSLYNDSTVNLDNVAIANMISVLNCLNLSTDIADWQGNDPSAVAVKGFTPGSNFYIYNYSNAVGIPANEIRRCYTHAPTMADRYTHYSTSVINLQYIHESWYGDTYLSAQDEFVRCVGTELTNAVLAINETGTALFSSAEAVSNMVGATVLYLQKNPASSYNDFLLNNTITSGSAVVNGTTYTVRFTTPSRAFYNNIQTALNGRQIVTSFNKDTARKKEHSPRKFAAFHFSRTSKRAAQNYTSK